MTADALAGLRAEVARAICAIEDPEGAWHCESSCVRDRWRARSGRTVECLYLKHADAAIARVLAFAADHGEQQIDALMREGSDASRDAAQFLVGRVNDLRRLATAARGAT